MRHTLRALAAAALAAALVTATPGTADAATCAIPAGKFRMLKSYGCGSAGYITIPGEGGVYTGYCQDLTHDGNVLYIEYQRPNGTWSRLCGDSTVDDKASYYRRTGLPRGAVRMRAGLQSVLLTVGP
jgi:hypothetical protein